MDLEALEAIRRLIAIYAQLLDSGRIAEWSELFTRDAVFEVWGKAYRGRAEIAAGIGGMQPELPGKHVCLAPVIDLLGPDRARAWTDLSAFASTQVTLDDEPDGLRTMTVRVTGPRGTLPAPYVEYLGRELRLSLTVPGEVVRSNATSVAGQTATWVRALVELQQEAEPTFRVTYRPGAAS